MSVAHLLRGEVTRGRRRLPSEQDTTRNSFVKQRVSRREIVATARAPNHKYAGEDLKRRLLLRRGGRPSTWVNSLRPGGGGDAAAELWVKGRERQSTHLRERLSRRGGGFEGGRWGGGGGGAGLLSNPPKRSGDPNETLKKSSFWRFTLWLVAPMCRAFRSAWRKTNYRRGQRARRDPGRDPRLFLSPLPTCLAVWRRIPLQQHS